MKIRFISGIEVLSIVKKDTIEQNTVSKVIDDLISLADPKYFLNQTSMQGEIGELEEILRDEPHLQIWDTVSVLEDFVTKKEIEKYNEEEKKGVVYYYVERPEKKKTNYYIFTPDWITIIRVPQSEIGQGVLGVAYIGLNLIKVLETLYGDDFVEVKKHELLHLQYPNETEQWIRKRTTAELSFQTKYQ